ncbi:hypothetical protein [Phaeobacter sp. 11ANDIMAR09]|nr:hypothetical protein [Phaeobacter sp. 11ANDIMAR09]
MAQIDQSQAAIPKDQGSAVRKAAPIDPDVPASAAAAIDIFHILDEKLM